jgi:hypothetical protein
MNKKVDAKDFTEIQRAKHVVDNLLRRHISPFVLFDVRQEILDSNTFPNFKQPTMVLPIAHLRRN